MVKKAKKNNIKKPAWEYQNKKDKTDNKIIVSDAKTKSGIVKCPVNNFKFMVRSLINLEVFRNFTSSYSILI